MKKNLNEIFTIEREVASGKGVSNYLAKLEGGLVLLGECVIPTNGQIGAKEMKAYTFLCVKEGEACIRFADTKNYGTVVVLEEPLRITISDIEEVGKDEESLQNDDTQQVSKICCVNAAGFVQEFRVMWKNDTGNGSTDLSGHYANPNSKTIDLDKYAIPDGAEVWVKVHAIWGKTKESVKHVTYAKGSGNVATYRTKGATLTFSITLEN